MHAEKMSEPALHTLTLTCHPLLPTDNIERFTASAGRNADGGLRFRYVVHGEVGRIALPANTTPQHMDNLWRHTCFEAFITAEDQRSYVECNFSPSSAWATYRFSRYRRGMAAIVPAEPPHISLHTARDSLVLDVKFRLNEFANCPLRISLTAAIEDTAGSLSYWALHHPSAKPDFHHRGGFILRLAE